MRSELHVRLISSVGVVFLFGGMAFAKTKQIDVLFPSTVGNSLKLQPGKYRIDVAQNMKKSEVKFYNRNGNLVGQVPAKVVDRTQKNHRTQIDYDKLASNHEVLTEISPRGWRENLVFNHPGANQKTARE
ncbi:MAG TPA: hypothetical protein VMV34_10125 [Terriglobia bacterium]|nr:hypothetical protein [Terriglobia bacterium]